MEADTPSSRVGVPPHRPRPVESAPQEASEWVDWGPRDHISQHSRVMLRPSLGATVLEFRTTIHPQRQGNRGRLESVLASLSVCQHSSILCPSLSTCFPHILPHLSTEHFQPPNSLRHHLGFSPVPYLSSNRIHHPPGHPDLRHQHFSPELLLSLPLWLSGFHALPQPVLLPAARRIF